MFNKLFKNKKGIITGFLGSLVNIVSDTFSYIRDLFSLMLSKAPKIVYPILFLFFILIIAGLMNFFLQMTGFHCDMDKNTVKTSTFNVPDNWDIWQFEISDQTVNSTIINMENTGWGVSKCSKTVTDGYYIFGNGTQVNFTDEISFYDGEFCGICEESVRVFGNDAETVFGVSGRRLCLGDVFRSSNISGRYLLFWSKKELCESGVGGAFSNKQCMPPENYFFDSSENFYLSMFDTGEGITLGETYNNLLFTQYKAVHFSFHNETKIVDVSCNNDFEMELTFFTINIFNFTLWVLLFILGAVIMVYTKFFMGK